MGIHMEQGPFHVHFVGIGGIGMSGIAKILVDMGWHVSGSDLVASEKTDSLAAAGVMVHIGHRGENVAGAKLVVVSAAIPRDNSELLFAQNHGTKVVTRAQMLGSLMQDRLGIAVAGTHGKTTTTSMISLVLEKLGCDPTVVVGGEVFDIGGNGKLGSGPYLVVEADESDGSLLELPAQIAVVTNVEADHLDHYADLEAVRATFLDFMRQIPPSGLVVSCADDEGLAKLVGQINCRHVDYGLQNRGYWWAAELQFLPFGSKSTIWRGQEKIGCLDLQVPGKHNISNALAVLAVADELHLPIGEAMVTLSEFRGVARRFERLGESGGVLVIDDYAHHPTEIKATLAAARHLHRRIVAVFQPHRYTRVARLMQEFASSFCDADQLILTDIYSAGEKPIPGISGEVLAKAVSKTGYAHLTYIPHKGDIPSFLAKTVLDGDVVLTLGAGDIREVGIQFLQKERVVSKCLEYESTAKDHWRVLSPLAEQKTQF
jgi:UDP-N-acetylmuramate--alanine ligase